MDNILQVYFLINCFKFCRIKNDRSRVIYIK